jgi:hypothetical protein
MQSQTWDCSAMRLQDKFHCRLVFHYIVLSTFLSLADLAWAVGCRLDLKFGFGTNVQNTRAVPSRYLRIKIVQANRRRQNPVVACPLGTLWLKSVCQSCQKAQQCVDPTGVDCGTTMGSGSCSTCTITTSAQSDAELSDSWEVVNAGM